MVTTVHVIAKMFQSTATSLLKPFELSKGGTLTHLKVQTLLVPSATEIRKPDYPRLRRYFLIQRSRCTTVPLSVLMLMLVAGLPRL